MDSDSCSGRRAPAGKPPSITEKLNEVVASALLAPNLNEWLEPLRAVVTGNSPDRFRAGLHREAAQWAEQFSNIKIELQ